MNSDPYESFRAKALQARSIDTLIGLCKGVIADGRVNQEEAEFLQNWLESNIHVAKQFPASVIYPRIVKYLADGELDEGESRELLELLKQCTGEQGQQGKAAMTTGVAFDNPQPVLDFQDAKFCLTGQFAYGSKNDVTRRIASLGGAVVTSVHKRGCYVVVGCMGTRSWLHETHGAKIIKAVEAKEQGCPVHIVSEEHWHEECQCTEDEMLGFERAADYEVQLRKTFESFDDIGDPEGF